LHGLYWLTANAAARRPLLLALDDLHWSDLLSLRWLAYLLPRIEGIGVSVVAALRPTEPGTDAALLSHIVADPLATVIRPAPMTAAGAAELLRAMGPLRERFDEIGITGYPETHHLISDEETIQAMFAKAPMATCIISQICFDADVIAGWIAEVRRRGTALPIWIGLPGSVDYAKLVRVSMKIGLGESARFLRLHSNWISRLMTRQFKPDPLLRGLAPTIADPAANAAGFHVYTFNEVARTERWRREALARLGVTPSR
jgi:methylenetetrahydrofolate reductase (NADPH)